jgi:integrase
MSPRQRAPRGTPEPSYNAQRRDWGVRIEVPADPGQPRKRKWVRAKTKEECQEKLSRALVSLADVGVVTDGRVTVEQVSRLWLDFMKNRVSHGSWVAYRTRVENHIVPSQIGTRRLMALSTPDVDAWQKSLEAKGLAVSTRREVRSTLVIIISWAQGRDYVMRNVAALSAGPSGSGKRVVSLSKPEARAVLEAVEGWRLEAVIVLMLTSGLRIGEALGLRWIDLSGDQLSIAGTLASKPSLHYKPEPKTAESRRTVALSQRALAALEAHRERQELERQALDLEPAQHIFLTRSQTLIDPSTVASELKTRTAHICPVHPHKLRHTAASLMIDSGVPIQTVSKVLGHKSIRTTLDIYGHLLDDGRASAASAMDAALG